MSTNKEVELGDVVKDRVTSFTGVIIAITEWLNGCRRVTIQPRELKDGSPRPSESFDIEQVEVVEKAAVPTKPVKSRTGGPMPEPQRGASIR